ncbi:MAG: NADH-quinone oxidoreductase subunit I [Chloroflexi bacterium]|nr:NADH-quinone oxidoreductase subunit I [Chloroflexota bacterium]
MFGLGVVKGMGVTLKHLIDTYIEDFSHAGRRYRPDAASVRQLPSGRGSFTVQYPEEKLAIPERFRFFPFLLKEQVADDAGGGMVWKDRCTACGICAKVCPPQCIWIVQAKKPDGKPKPEPDEFYIDTSICMQCGYCAEFCPFDAIKMNHVFELSTYERHQSHIYTKEMLTLPVEYYAETHPIAYAQEEADRAAKASKSKR